MLDIGLGEVIVIAVLALLVFGPDRLPKVAADAARTLRQVRQMAVAARKDLSDAARVQSDPELAQAVRDIRDLDPRRALRGLDEEPGGGPALKGGTGPARARGAAGPGAAGSDVGPGSKGVDRAAGAVAAGTAGAAGSVAGGTGAGSSAGSSTGPGAGPATAAGEPTVDPAAGPVLNPAPADPDWT